MPINWNVRALRRKPRYQDVYLAYLDVLGFKNLMKRYAKESPRHLVRLFEKIDDAVHHPRESGLVQQYLSDSILIWCTRPSSLPYMFDVCNMLQDELLLEGCLIRGAIVSGQHYWGYFDQLNLATGARNKQSGEIIISPALVKAYLIESKLWEPVIKIEGSVLIDHNSLFKGLPRKLRPPRKRFSPARLYDLPGYLLSLRFGVLRAGASSSQRPSKKWQVHPDVKKEIAAIKQIRRRILSGIENSDPKIARKWKYVRKMFNSRVRPLTKSWDLMGDITIDRYAV